MLLDESQTTTAAAVSSQPPPRSVAPSLQLYEAQLYDVTVATLPVAAPAATVTSPVTTGVTSNTPSMMYIVER